MKESGAYKGREQTYLKHFFLERYLERVAFNIGWASPEFIYVDGFSGPWRSEDETFEDTSFIIAIQQLRKVRDTLAEHGKTPRIRCLFVEKDAAAFARLERAIAAVDDIEVHALQGEFESLISDITKHIGSSFALTFIDPTGWTGFALKTIAPLLHKRGEVLINFMFDFINRFLEGDRDDLSASFDALFGGPGWEEALEEGELALLDYYQVRLKDVGNFNFATRTRILKPLSERTYFHLVYCTRHQKGLIEFRSVERKFLEKQENVRSDAKQDTRIKRTGQGELFRESACPTPADFQAEQDRNNATARETLLRIVREKKQVRYEDVIPLMLEIPMVHESAAKRLMATAAREGLLRIIGMQPRQKLPKKGCQLRLTE